MMVVSAGRDECRLRAVTLHEFEPEHAAIERKRAIEIGHFKVNVADRDAGIDGTLRLGAAEPVDARGEAMCGPL